MVFGPSALGYAGPRSRDLRVHEICKISARSARSRRSLRSLIRRDAQAHLS
eukprot:NODE_8791_length_501_cov_3.601770_g7724_i0.p4 GENE.NODE_8791_length_501_cov_3.601770_g7724_i0~~NODE_8791_length_501_cov_3.601770_g7724_i0.p4  ORF type:complete len:51 (-),score=1.16 NODE_8791_length_501_cov_3.601770_g7724_i0:80-232(-)